MRTKKILGLFIGILFLIFMLIFFIFNLNSFPHFNEKDIDICIFDISREKYKDYPELKDHVVTAYTKSENEAFISIDIKASSKEMRRFDKMRESEVKGWLFDFARTIQNPFGLSMLITVSNEYEHSEKTIIYTAYLDWQFEYNMPSYPWKVEREVEYDRPLSY